MLCTLNLYSDICQFYLTKTGVGGEYQSNILILLVLGVVCIEVLWKTFPVIGMCSPPAAHSDFVLFYGIYEWDSWGVILFCFVGYKCPLSFILYSSLQIQHRTHSG